MSVFIRAKAGIEPTMNTWSFSGWGDPSQLGLAAGVGSTYTQLDSSPPGDEWTKTGPQDTDWVLQLALPAAQAQLSADTVAALVGTVGAPSATNRFVTDSDGRLLGGGSGSGQGLPSMVVATAPPSGTALTGDGSTDDGPALDTLANTTMAGSGTIYFTPGKTYRIATATTIPKGVTLWLPQGATLKADGVTLTIRGAVDAGIWPIFSYVNGGQVLFTASNTEAASKRAVQNTEVYPEWWGAVADGVTDDAPAINNCITAISGLPGATSGSRWASAMIRLSQGSYRVNQTIQIASLHGLRIEGAGYQTSRIVWAGAGATGTASSGSTTTLVDSSKSWTTNAYAPGATTLWWAYIYGGTGIGQWAQIASNTATTLTFNTAVSVAPDNTSTYYVVPQAVLDLDGAFDCQIEGISVSGGSSSTQYVRHGIYYHWLGSVSAASSSRLKMYGVQVTGAVITSAFAFGGIDTAEENQADMVGLFGCQALGNWSASSSNGLYQNGFIFGSGVFSNPLNYNAYDCESVGYQNGVTVSSTNVLWSGGTVQSNGSDVNIQNGVQGYSVFSGFRSENSQRLVTSGSGQVLGMNVRFADINFLLNDFANNPATSQPDLIYWKCPGTLTLDNISALSGGLTTRTMDSATSTTATYASWNLPTANGGVTGWMAVVKAGTDAGDRQLITGNTATSITVAGWQVTPDNTSQIEIYPAPRVAIANTTAVLARGCVMQGTTLDRFVYGASGGAPQVTIESYERVDEGAAPQGTVAPSPLVFGGTSNVVPKATLGMGVTGSVPDAIWTRHKAGTMGTPAVEAASVRTLKYGAVPAPYVQIGSGSGSTSYTYYLVAKDGSGNPLGLVSSGTTVTGQAATLAYGGAYNAIYLPNGNHVPAVYYDILRGDTSHAVATNVPWYHFPHKDYRNTTDSYSPPGSDGTGNLTVDGNATITGTVNSATISTSTIPTAAQLSGLTGGADTTLHYHAADRARANHTGTQSLSTITGGTASGSGYTLPDLTVSGLLTANGGISGQLALVTKTADYTVATTDQALLGDATSGNLTFTLPAAATLGKRELFVKKIDSSANTVRIAAAGSDTIDGQASITLSAQYAALDIISDGVSKWEVASTTSAVLASAVTPGTFGNGAYTFPSTVTFQGNVTHSSGTTATFSGATYTAGPIGQRYFNAGNSSTALTLNFINGMWQKVTLTGNCTFTFTAPPNPGAIRLWLIQDATGSRTVTWPASVKWVAATAPTLSTAAAATDIIDLEYDGTNYWGRAFGLGF